MASFLAEAPNTPPPEASHRRAIRSFVVRAGRMTPGQRQALERLWPRYGLDLPDGAIDLDQAFGRQAPRTLEIGFGMGDALLALATDHPGQDFIGVEVYPPGIGSFLLRVEQAGLGNVRVICADAVEVLARHLPAASLDRLLVLFPDPWPKKRHHKRRLVSVATLRDLARVMTPGAELRVATDIGEYARWILLAVREQRSFSWTAQGPRDWRERGADWPSTRYEQKALAEGRRCSYFRFRRA